MQEPKDIFSHIAVEKIEIPEESYFTSIAETIIKTSKAETKIIPLYRKKIFKWAIAAAIFLPIAIFFMIQSNNVSSKEDAVLYGLNDITTEEIHSYIMDNREEFNLIEVAEMTFTETLANFTIESETSNRINTDFFGILSQEEIELYFELNEINIEELEQEELFI